LREEVDANQLQCAHTMAGPRMPLLLALFFCSGACGLAYQVLWLRQLSFVFGVTAYAASTVLAAFMAGLALGSWLAGPLLERIRRPLAAFGVAEVLVGCSAIATPWMLGLASVLYRQLYAVAPDAFLLQTAARFACAFAVLLVPTMLMGMTLPLLSASHLVRGVQFSARVSALYAVNTAGAVLGALLTGYILIGAIGMQRTFLLAAVTNILIGLTAILVDRRRDGPAATAATPVVTPIASADIARGPRVVWAVMALSGFGALALEVVWFRLMTQFVDATTYAFTSILAVVLTGIALGGAMAARALRRDRDWHAHLAAIQLATGLVVLVGAGLMSWEEAGGIERMRPMRRVMAGVLLPSLLMGFSFPALLRLGVPPSHGHDADGASRGRLVGRFYGVNVLGAILGSLAGGFLLLPLLGTRRSFIVLAGVFVACGIALFATHPRRARGAVLAIAGLAGFALLVVATPDPFSYAARLRAEANAVEIFRDEGVQTAVSVHTTRFQRTLRVGGLHQANDSAGMVRLHHTIGLLPMALHPAPRSALVIGLGGGATAGALSQHAGTSVQIVELSDSVRKAAAFFSHVTYDVLNRPNVRLRVDDGRNFLLLSGERFDVITADLIQPVHAGAGNLYSREYFQLVRRALNDGGLVLQWIGERERSHYVLIMRTFLDVFPDATLWLGGQLMVGSLGPLTLDEAAFAAKLADPATRAAMAAIGLDSFAALRSWYTAGPKEMAAFVGPGAVLTDDLPLVEYHRSLAGGDRRLDLTLIRGDVRDLDAR
jgi:spermidine synthase